MPEGTLTVGNVEILAINDNDSALPLSQIFPDVPPEAWIPYQKRYPQSFMSKEDLIIHFDCYLIRSEGQLILVDTGLGGMISNPDAVSETVGGMDGRLLTELQNLGISEEEINTVFLTHLHFDHVGWNVSGGAANPTLTFPNARYLAHQADWDVFQPPRDEEIFGFPFFENLLTPLQAQGQLDLLTGEHSLTSEITAIPTPGHTPGSMSLMVSSQGQRAYIMGDVFHAPAQVTEPDWVFSFDMDPALAVQTRTLMVERAEEEDAAMAICHHSGFGKVIRDEGRRYWQVL